VSKVEVLPKKASRGDKRIDLVPTFAQRVALIIIDFQEHFMAVRTHSLHDLLRLEQWHPRIVFSVTDHQRDVDVIDMCERRNVLQHFSIMLELAVF